VVIQFDHIQGVIVRFRTINESATSEFSHASRGLIREPIYNIPHRRDIAPDGNIVIPRYPGNRLSDIIKRSNQSLLSLKLDFLHLLETIDLLK